MYIDKDLGTLQEKIGYRFKDEKILSQALNHSSFVNEHRRHHLSDNERLEFLGDAVLELCSSEFLYRNYPRMPEGDMTRLRASLVCEPTLALCARALDLPKFIRLGRGEELTGGRRRDSIVSDALEAVIGAIYLDGGLAGAKEFIEHSILNDIEHKKLFYDSKTILQELVQQTRKGEAIAYELTGEEGPVHAREYLADVRIGESVMGSGRGSTKKAAEQEAAYRALLKLEENN